MNERALNTRTRKPYRGISMEGQLATWYARTTGKDAAEFQRLAAELASGLANGARVLEIAPGPGYLAVALAKLGRFKITGLDISKSFVRMASEYARKEGVVVRFMHGSASDIPVEDGFFDLTVCRAAFKNFSEPLKALNEMHRVLKPGGKAVVIDLRKDTSLEEIDAYVSRAGLGTFDAWFTKMTFKHMLLKRAYTQKVMEALIQSSDFESGQIVSTGIGMEVTLERKRPIATQAA